MSEDVFYGISFSFEYFTSRFQVHAIIYLAVIIVCEVGYYQLMFHIMVGTNKQLLFFNTVRQLYFSYICKCFC